MGRKRQVIRRRALCVTQDPKRPLYLFTLDGDELFQVSEISRIGRGQDGELLGYQRPEVKNHVRNIVEYLDSGRVLFPNALILALGDGVKFIRDRGEEKDEGVGFLEITIPAEGDPKPGWIVDGQQRALAISKAKRKDLRFPVTAFVAQDVETQREQFLRINSARPLPRGLITELLPEVRTVLPPKLAARRLPSALCEVLNSDSESPFRGLIRRASLGRPARKAAPVTDTAVVQMLEDSLMNPSGCLFPFRNIATGETDHASVRTVLFTYWNAVRETFPDAWGRAPAESRLMHGAGIRAMGKLMDRVMGAVDHRSPRASELVCKELERVGASCHWTSGRWKDLEDLPWNGIQNTPSHIRALSNLLIRKYLGQEQRKTA